MLSSEHRAHDPSPRKIGKARLAGHVAQSRELGSAIVLFAAGVALLAAGRSVVGGLVVFMRDALRVATGGGPGRAALDAGIGAVVGALACPLAVIVLSALTIGLVQTRGLFRGRGPLPSSIRLVPRLRRLLGADRAVVAGAGLAKTAVLLLVCATAFVAVAPALPGLCGRRPLRLLEAFFVTAKSVGAALTFAMLGVGLADYVWQLRRHSKSLRMSTDEVKREQKENEGDPAFKHERKRLHLELTQAFASVADADVVVVDPEGAAVALRFVAELAAAPTVLRKGRGAVASHIEVLAAEAGVPVVVSPELAAALDGTDEGHEIPESLYEDVAELIVDAKLTSGVANPVERPYSASEVGDAQ